MIKIIEKHNCCGCGACSQACPVSCIEMERDKEGFYYPKVNKHKCVSCGKCEVVCPVINAKDQSDEIISSYAAYAKNEDILTKSSSGGIFSLVALWIISSGGVVFGASFDDNSSVRHIYVDKKEDLYLLQGSKYVQSNTYDSYVLAEQFLKTRRNVLFTGTACQISGLKRYLGKEYDELFTIDVLCHGVPSPLLWEKYCAEISKKFSKNISSIYFRDKTYGWNDFSMTFVFDDNQIERKKYFNDPYMSLFLGNICLRPSCYHCKFKGLSRDSDITIGDCWGVEKTCQEMNNYNGVSVIITHTSKGQSILQNIENELVLKEEKVDLLLSPLADSRVSVKEHDNRQLFFRRLKWKRNVSELAILLEPTMGTKIRRKIKKYANKAKGGFGKN